jgi:4-hydroxybenzoate polyprenyltransferase
MHEALAATSKIEVLLPSSKIGVSRESRQKTSSFETLSEPLITTSSARNPHSALTTVIEALRPVHALHFYGAAGIAVFGWSLGHWNGFASGSLLPLWLAGALVVYNLDRLKRDPSDTVNTPERVRLHAGLRRCSWLVTIIAGAVLVLWPLWIRSAGLLCLTALALPMALSYSFPVLGGRIKDVPVLKTLFAPLVVLAAVLAPPIFFQGLQVSGALAIAAGWGWALLMFNMLLCDLRDIDGDRAAGIRSLPVVLGENGTMVLLWATIAAGATCAFIRGWPILACATIAALSPLAIAAQRRRNEAFYEWLAEGTLFLPALVELGKHLAHRLA